VIEALTTGRLILSGLIVHQQMYRPSDRSTDYWAADTLGTDSPPADVPT
jgi:hypothetical protein